MNDMTENAQVIDRQWPAPKTLTREASVDEHTREALFRSYAWVKTLSEDTLRDFFGDVLEAAFRGNYRDDSERLYAIKDAIESLAETWAENMSEEEE